MGGLAVQPTGASAQTPTSQLTGLTQGPWGLMGRPSDSWTMAESGRNVAPQSASGTVYAGGTPAFDERTGTYTQQQTPAQLAVQPQSNPYAMNSPLGSSVCPPNQPQPRVPASMPSSKGSGAMNPNIYSRY